MQTQKHDLPTGLRRGLLLLLFALGLSALLLATAFAAPSGPRVGKLTCQRTTEYPALTAYLDGGLPTSQQPPQGDLTVHITANGSTFAVHTGKGTVSDALAAAGLTYTAYDSISPAACTLLVDGMAIELSEVTLSYEKVESALPRAVVEEPTSALMVGETAVKQAGADGLRQDTYRVLQSGGRVLERTLAASEVLREATDEVLYVGTREDAIIETPEVVPLQNDGRDHDLPLYESLVERVVTMEATAYTHTGNTTATGTMPKLGTIAVNPKQIPYGTLLYVEGYGFGRAEDTGGFRHNGRAQLDLFMDTEDECWQWGHKRGLTVYVLKETEYFDYERIFSSSTDPAEPAGEGEA